MTPCLQATTASSAILLWVGESSDFATNRRVVVGAFFLDAGSWSGTGGWWFAEAKSFGTNGLVFAEGKVDDVPAAGWQLRGPFGLTFTAMPINVAVRKTLASTAPSSAVTEENLLGTANIALGAAQHCYAFLSHPDTIAAAKSCVAFCFNPEQVATSEVRSLADPDASNDSPRRKVSFRSVEVVPVADLSHHHEALEAAAKVEADLPSKPNDDAKTATWEIQAARIRALETELTAEKLRSSEGELRYQEAMRLADETATRCSELESELTQMQSELVKRSALEVAHFHAVRLAEDTAEHCAQLQAELAQLKNEREQEFHTVSESIQRHSDLERERLRLQSKLAEQHSGKLKSEVTRLQAKLAQLEANHQTNPDHPSEHASAQLHAQNLPEVEIPLEEPLAEAVGTHSDSQLDELQVNGQHSLAADAAERCQHCSELEAQLQQLGALKQHANIWDVSSDSIPFVQHQQALDNLITTYEIQFSEFQRLIQDASKEREQAVAVAEEHNKRCQELEQFKAETTRNKSSVLAADRSTSIDDTIDGSCLPTVAHSQQLEADIEHKESDRLQALSLLEAERERCLRLEAELEILRSRDAPAGNEADSAQLQVEVLHLQAELERMRQDSTQKEVDNQDALRLVETKAGMFSKVQLKSEHSLELESVWQDNHTDQLQEATWNCQRLEADLHEKEAERRQALELAEANQKRCALLEAELWQLRQLETTAPPDLDSSEITVVASQHGDLQYQQEPQELNTTLQEAEPALLDVQAFVAKRESEQSQHEDQHYQPVMSSLPRTVDTHAAAVEDPHPASPAPLPSLGARRPSATASPPAHDRFQQPSSELPRHWQVQVPATAPAEAPGDIPPSHPLRVSLPSRQPEEKLQQSPAFVTRAEQECIPSSVDGHAALVDEPHPASPVPHKSIDSSTPAVTSPSVDFRLNEGQQANSEGPSTTAARMNNFGAAIAAQFANPSVLQMFSSPLTPRPGSWSSAEPQLQPTLANQLSAASLQSNTPRDSGIAPSSMAAFAAKHMPGFQPNTPPIAIQERTRLSAGAQPQATYERSPSQPSTASPQPVTPRVIVPSTAAAVPGNQMPGFQPSAAPTKAIQERIRSYWERHHPPANGSEHPKPPLVTAEPQFSPRGVAGPGYAAVGAVHPSSAQMPTLGTPAVPSNFMAPRAAQFHGRPARPPRSVVVYNTVTGS